jgi:hypothetical protein
VMGRSLVTGDVPRGLMWYPVPCAGRDTREVHHRQAALWRSVSLSRRHYMYAFRG